MRLFALTALTMLAFAANSILNRAAIVDGGMDPVGFALIRVLSGAGALIVLVGLRRGARRGSKGRAPQKNSVRRVDVVSVLSLVAYLLGFSFAYQSMDAGLGALILFGGVQMTMFAGAVLRQEPVGVGRWGGAAMALIGLIFLLWPSENLRLNVASALLMGVAALGWGIYSLAGQRRADPLASTCWNFIYAAPIVALGAGLATSGGVIVGPGLWLALLSGAVTSGMGYALWYAILPQLGASRGALAQLSVPVLAMAMGVGLLGESLAVQTVLSAAIVLVGIGVGVFVRK